MQKRITDLVCACREFIAIRPLYLDLSTPLAIYNVPIVLVIGGILHEA